MNNSSWYGGRKRSLEWNDEVASGAKNAISRRDKRLKSKILSKHKNK